MMDLGPDKTSSKRQGNNVQNRNGGQKSNIIGGGNFNNFFESGNLVGEGMMDLGQVVERPPPKRQRHFSLEDYNDLIMESSNSNASIDNSTDDNNMMMNGGINDQQPTSNSSTAAITSFANLGKFFSNFNSSSPLSRRNSFSTNNFAGNKFGNTDSIKPYNGTNFGNNYHPGDGFMPSAA